MLWKTLSAQNPATVKPEFFFFATFSMTGEDLDPLSNIYRLLGHCFSQKNDESALQVHNFY